MLVLINLILTGELQKALFLINYMAKQSVLCKNLKMVE